MEKPRSLSRSLQLLLVSLVFGALVVACGPQEPEPTTAPAPTTTAPADPAADPAVTDPATPADPAADPAVTDPAAADPAATDPAADPAATDPAADPVADPATDPETAVAEPGAEQVEPTTTTPTATPIAPATTPTEEEPEEEPEEEVTPEEEPQTEEAEPAGEEEAQETAAPAEGGEVVLTLGAVGDDAWVLNSVEGAENVAEEGQENPTLTLNVGTRYRIINEGGAEHPLDFRAEDNTTFLLAQGDVPGEFEDDQEVNWQDTTNEVSFTLTQELADQLAAYYCTVHPDMRGDIQIAGAN